MAYPAITRGCRVQAWRHLTAAAVAAPAHRPDRSQHKRLYSPPRAQQQQSQHGSEEQQQQQQQQQQPDSTADAPEMPGAAKVPAGEASKTASKTASKASSRHMEGGLYSYMLRHTREAPVLAALREDTAQRYPSAAHMAVSPEQGAFMAWLVHTLGAQRVIEVGVFTGYSSVALALALPPGGRLVACERDPKALAIARGYWQQAGVAEKVEERLGSAAQTLDSLLADPQQHGSYDFAFIDADKKGYRSYYEQLLQLVRPGGVIALDNVLWYGKVADSDVDDGATAALRELNDFLVTDERIAFSLVPVGDGIALATKR